jgi:hypothetical protein
MHAFQIETLVYTIRGGGFMIREHPITYLAGKSSFNASVAIEALGVWWETA